MILDFISAKKERDPHISGQARCMDCKHEWQAVAPVDTWWLECPSCSLPKGRFIGTFQKSDRHWTCHCGNDLFHVAPAGIYCPNCGDWQSL